MVSVNRVPGHTLRAEGAPHVVDETGEVVRVYRAWGSVGGFGRGLCSCGELSPLLDSAHKRKQWHREHKAEVAR